MNAKWFWTTWAHFTLVAVIVVEVLFVWFLAIMILPKFEKLQHDGYIDPHLFVEPETACMPEILDGVKKGTGQSGVLWLLAIAVAWGIFEWRVSSENKAFMRLSALGTAALALLAVVVLTAGILVVSFCLGMPAMGRIARPYAVQQVARIDAAVTAAEQALAAKDWKEIEKHTSDAKETTAKLLEAGPAIASLSAGNHAPSVAELRREVSISHQDLGEALEAIRLADAAQLQTAFQKFRKSFESVREAAKRPAP